MAEKNIYNPPCTLTPEILNRVARISEHIGRITADPDIDSESRLRRINRIRTIHGSLAIEGNTLDEEAITAILEGKKVIAPPREIREAENALSTYEQLESIHAHRVDDLLRAHALLMKGLVDTPGTWRTSGVGVMSGDTVIHMAPPADRVPLLMNDLTNWLASTEHHPLVAGSIFHYEFEFIHPFSDGNGRMGRLLQTAILMEWAPVFSSIPVERMVYQNQQEYYRVIQESTNQSDSAPFVEFMLEMIESSIENTLTPQVAHHVTPQVAKLLEVLSGEMSRNELQNLLGLSDRKSFRERYLEPALEKGLIEMTIPDKPNSRLQKYRVTAKGHHK